ncbi:two-component system, NtrC family, sensor histidine kinase AtoS [Desulfofundulus australicus DSM 11792]|uniref:histidine kinase n=1 Tax=Desulfofundulus australicus DSM 11792 TaxID=1121425 RepID=A0A1M4Y789_9FIRM|nr:ATP-binding protein [Desulfofundulus australicus]SHF01631.1 two-component system, NtrC family, sensor histidine kinase AtoS [Desulfofundulus australicus DSM 11792]
MDSVQTGIEKLAIMGQLAAQVVHEIKNSLTTVRGFLQLLKEKQNVPSRQEYFDLMLEAIDHANNIITNYLHLARPGNNSCRKIYAPQKLLTEVSMLMESEAALKNISLKMVIPENLPPLLIDPEQIKEVLINIIKNSLEAMPDGGEVTIRACCDNRKLYIAISDTGTGIEEPVLENIFEPFYTTKASGTGLGLFIARQIIHNHKGEITVKSTPGRGTTMFITLPVLSQEEKPGYMDIQHQTHSLFT